MRAVIGGVVLGLVIAGPRVLATAADDATPEVVLRSYLAAVKEQRFEDAYDRVSKAMRQGKSKEDWAKEQKGLMALADVKIFSFTVYPGKISDRKSVV